MAGIEIRNGDWLAGRSSWPYGSENNRSSSTRLSARSTAPTYCVECPGSTKSDAPRALIPSFALPEFAAEYEEVASAYELAPALSVQYA